MTGLGDGPQRRVILKMCCFNMIVCKTLYSFCHVPPTLLHRKWKYKTCFSWDDKLIHRCSGIRGRIWLYNTEGWNTSQGEEAGKTRQMLNFGCSFTTPDRTEGPARQDVGHCIWNGLVTWFPPILQHVTQLHRFEFISFYHYALRSATKKLKFKLFTSNSLLSL